MILASPVEPLPAAGQPHPGRRMAWIYPYSYWRDVRGREGISLQQRGFPAECHALVTVGQTAFLGPGKAVHTGTWHSGHYLRSPWPAWLSVGDMLRAAHWLADYHRFTAPRGEAWIEGLENVLAMPRVQAEAVVALASLEQS